MVVLLLRDCPTRQPSPAYIGIQKGQYVQYPVMEKMTYVSTLKMKVMRLVERKKVTQFSGLPQFSLFWSQSLHVFLAKSFIEVN